MAPPHTRFLNGRAEIVDMVEGQAAGFDRQSVERLVVEIGPVEGLGRLTALTVRAAVRLKSRRHHHTARVDRIHRHIGFVQGANGAHYVALGR